MDLIRNIHDLRKTCDAIEKKARQQSSICFTLISKVVKMHQEQRVAKNYTVSDVLRSLLNDVGVEIVQGTSGYKYEEIPQSLKGRQTEDTWKFR